MEEENWKYLATTTHRMSQLSVQAPASCEPAKAIPPKSTPKSLAPDHEVRTSANKESTTTSVKPLPVITREMASTSIPAQRVTFKPFAIPTRDKGEQPGLAYLKRVQPVS